MKSKKKSNRRSLIKNPSLKKSYNTRIRQEYIDLDYIDKLDDTKKVCKLPDGTKVTELEFMAIFMKEWNNGGVGKQKNAKENRMHRTAKEVKNCTDRTNQRNRDQYGMAKAQNLVHKTEDDKIKDYIERSEVIGINYVEEALVDFLDSPEDSNDTGSDTNE